jgi:hypothetical protein
LRIVTRAKAPESVEEYLRVRNGLFFLLRAAVCCLVFAGCGNPAGHYPVSGRVLYNGEPASGAVVDISKPLLHAEVLPQSNSLPPFENGG